LDSLTTDGFEVIYRKPGRSTVGTFTVSADVACVWHFNLDENVIEPQYAGDNGAAFRPCGADFPL